LLANDEADVDDDCSAELELGPAAMGMITSLLAIVARSMEKTTALAVQTSASEISVT
jgi:hypothetical protein